MKVDTADIVAHGEEFTDSFAVNNWWRMRFYWNDHWSNSCSYSFWSDTVCIWATSTSARRVKFAMRVQKKTAISKSAVRKSPVTE